MLRKNGRENTIRSVSNVNASVCVCANAFFTMIAFVENRMEPMNAMINPVMGIAALVDFTFMSIVRIPMFNPGRQIR